MNLFVDTSAFLAILDRDDINHPKANEQWREIILSDSTLNCHNYILVETFVLLQNRFGMEAVRVFQEDLVPLLHVEWIDEGIHKLGMSAFLAASRKRLSLVDCISFETMRNSGIKIAFTFDPHFRAHGFTCIP
jgi:predicted nucleic acid-binding protein